MCLQAAEQDVPHTQHNTSCEVIAYVTSCGERRLTSGRALITSWERTLATRPRNTSVGPHLLKPDAKTLLLTGAQAAENGTWDAHALESKIHFTALPRDQRTMLSSIR